MSLKSDRDKVEKALSGLANGELVAIPAHIGTLRGIAAPKGNADTVHTIAKAYLMASTTTDQQSLQVAAVTRQDLPEVWVGKASDGAGDVMVAAAEDLANGAEVMVRAGRALNLLGDAFADAHTKYTEAQTTLHDAQSAADRVDYSQARSLGQQGGGKLRDALDAAINGSRDAARDLGQLATEARAHDLSGTNLSAADRLVLGEAAVPGGPHLDNEILTENEAKRAGEKLDALSPAERKRVDDLLAAAKSPQERAYIMKTLAAGHSVDEVAKFDGLIHNHGDDPAWLREHLTPIVDNGQKGNVTYKGASWTQGQYPTCVASSTILGRAMTDPAYTLELTTGNNPDDPASSSKDAFLSRLRDEQARVYDSNRDWWNHVINSDGMTDGEGQKAANAELGKYNGQQYQHHGVDGPGQVRDLLPSIENAVDQGKPVPVQVENGEWWPPDYKGHQVVVIGHRGDQLAVYNPWGTVTWISEDDFVNGRLDKIDGIPPTINGVTLPS